MCAPPDRAIVAAMTETTYGPPLPPPQSPPPQAPRPRLERDPDDKVVAGVCAAFARYTDTDPVLWRVTLAVLTLFGGAGLVLYVLGWALVPRSDRGTSFVERTLRGGDRGISAPGVVLLVVAGVVLLGILSDGPGLGALLVVGAVAYLVSRERRAPRPATSYDTPYDAGLGFGVALDKGEFNGREALAEAAERGRTRALCTLVVGGEDYLPLYGGEAVRVDGRTVGRARSCAYGFTVRRNIAYAYLPADLADRVAVEVEVLGAPVAAEVAADVLYDPEHLRVRG